MSETYTCGCGAVFEDKEMVELCEENQHDLDLEEFECGCGQVYDDPEAVDLCTNEGHPF